MMMVVKLSFFFRLKKMKINPQEPRGRKLYVNSAVDIHRTCSPSHRIEKTHVRIFEYAHHKQMDLKEKTARGNEKLEEGLYKIRRLWSYCLHQSNHR